VTVFQVRYLSPHSILIFLVIFYFGLPIEEEINLEHQVKRKFDLKEQYSKLEETLLISSNIETARIAKYEISPRVLKRKKKEKKQDKTTFSRSISPLCELSDYFFSIEKSTTIPFLIKSLIYSLVFSSCSFYILKAIDTYYVLGENWYGNFITASTALFVAIFAYNYTSFNNKWKYTADLYNKIYFDLSYKEDPIPLFRKRCILAQDIKLQGLHIHDSFKYEYSKTLIMAAIVFSEHFIHDSNSEPIFTIHSDGKVVTLNLDEGLLFGQCALLCSDAEVQKKSEDKLTNESKQGQINHFETMKITALSDDFLKLKSEIVEIKKDLDTLRDLRNSQNMHG
jgi:hypothetical protein